MTPKPFTAAFEASKDYIEQALPGKVAPYRGAHSRGGRVANPDEIAKAAVFLASNDKQPCVWTRYRSRWRARTGLALSAYKAEREDVI